MGLLTAPGLWLQRITTKPPDDAKAAVAIHALEGAMALEAKQGGESGRSLKRLVGADRMQYQQKLDDIERRFDELNAPDGGSRGHQRPRAVPQGHQSPQRTGRNRQQISRMEDRHPQSGRSPAHADRVRSRTARPWPRKKSRAWSPRSRSIEEELKILLLPKDPQRRERTWCSKSAPAPAATKPLSSPPRFSACTRASPKRAAGTWKSPPPANPPSAA